MSELKEYVVTLKNREDLEAFYNDMETEGGNLYIPDRRVDVAQRRAISRNTHYMLSTEEAETVKNDPRVLAVALTPEELGMTVRPHYVQTNNNFDKSSTEDVNDINWGLLRVYEGAQRANWGTDATSNQSGTINIQTTGKNVDVVIVDGMIDPAHPEYAVNSDGSGGTRVVQYNWFIHNPEVTGGAAGNYVYTPYDDPGAPDNDGNGVPDRTDDNAHGSHVAGTACGNTQGWARGANIYNINPYGTDINGVSALNLFDYIRAWHNSKAVNPDTGRRNPTVTNNSYGYSFAIPVANITSVNFRGQNFPGPFTNAQLFQNYGVLAFNSSGTNIAIIPARYAAFEADIQDAILDGILVVGAAGNDYMKMDVNGGQDFDNNVVAGGTNYYYHEGSAPSSADDVICVGSLGTLSQEYKSNFSNCGPRVDIWAPGSEIQSSVNTLTSYGGNIDPRAGATYALAKISGTSMASPQVCGVLACALEMYPWMTQAQAREYLFYHSKEQVGTTAGGFTDFTNTQGAPNRYLYHYNERPETGQLYPKKDYWLRDTQFSKVWPRPRVRRYG